MILVGGGGAKNLPRGARFSGFRCDWKRRWRGQRGFYRTGLKTNHFGSSLLWEAARLQVQPCVGAR